MNQRRQRRGLGLAALFGLLWVGGQAWAETIQYTYDALGRLGGVYNYSSGVSWNSYYDKMGNRVYATTDATVNCADLTVCNGNFEAGLALWRGVENATLVPGRSGQGAKVLPDANNSDIQQLLPGVFAGGKTYRLTAWCKADVGTVCRLFLGDVNLAYGPVYENSIGQSWGGNGAWQRISTPPLTLTHQERLNVYLYGAGTGVVYDDVQVEETTPYPCADRTVCNGDFERGFEFWDSVNNAILVAGRSAGAGAQVNQDANNSDIFQLLPGVFASGKTYRLSAWCKAEVGRQCGIFLGDVNNYYGSANENTVRQWLGGNGAWQQLSVNLTLTHDERLNVYLYGSNTNAIYDDVQVALASPLLALRAAEPVVIVKAVPAAGMASGTKVFAALAATPVWESGAAVVPTYADSFPRQVCPPDDGRLSAIAAPEPATLALFGLGLLGLGAVIRRRRSRG